MPFKSDYFNLLEDPFSFLFLKFVQIFPNSSKFCPTFFFIHNKTMQRMYRIKALGFEVFYIWEQDYKQYLFDKDNEFIEGLFEYYRLL